MAQPKRFLKIEVDFLENVLGLKRDHAGLVLEFLESVVELFLRSRLASHLHSKTLGVSVLVVADSSP